MERGTEKAASQGGALLPCRELSGQSRGWCCCTAGPAAPIVPAATARLDATVGEPGWTHRALVLSSKSWPSLGRSSANMPASKDRAHRRGRAMGSRSHALVASPERLPHSQQSCCCPPCSDPQPHMVPLVKASLLVSQALTCVDQAVDADAKEACDDRGCDGDQHRQEGEPA